MSWTWDATLPLLRTEPLIPQWKSLLAENGYIAHFMLTAKGQHTSPQLRMDTKSWLSFLLGDNSEGSTPLQSSLGDQLRPVMRLCLLPKPASPMLILQSCLTLCNPIDGGPPGSPVPGILQARIMEWVAIALCVCFVWLLGTCNCLPGAMAAPLHGESSFLHCRGPEGSPSQTVRVLGQDPTSQHPACHPGQGSI